MTRDNDAGAKTIKGYLKALLMALWEQGEGFSGNGLVEGKIDPEFKWLDEVDSKAASKIIEEAIQSL